MNRTSWVFIATATLICLLLGFFISRPNVTGAWKTYKETQSAKSELDKVSKKKDALATLSKNTQLSNIYDIAQKYIPEGQDSSGLVIALSALATGSKLGVDSLTFNTAATPAAAAQSSADTSTTDKSTATATAPSGTAATTTTGGSIKEVTFDMTISGTFPDFLSFLKNTETSSRLITFTKMSFSQSDKSFIAQLSGTSYWKQGGSLESTLENIKITQSTIDKFQNLKSYGTPINLPTENGFGNSNPFTPAP